MSYKRRNILFLELFLDKTVLETVLALRLSLSPYAEKGGGCGSAVPCLQKGFEREG